MSYADSYSKMISLVSVYVGPILKGEKRRDLPVQQTAKLERIIILKTAKTLGLDVPKLCSDAPTK
jgi:putative ABC transport system substrate-binding protein